VCSTAPGTSAASSVVRAAKSAAERAQAALDDIVALAADKPVAVFAHGGIGRVLRGLFVSAPQADIMEMDQPQDAFFRLHGGAIERIG